MKKHQCANCGVINKLPDNARLSESPCWSCGRPLIDTRDPKEAVEMTTAVGLMGGAVFGASIGGPVGALIGAVLGGLIGKEARGVG